MNLPEAHAAQGPSVLEEKWTIAPVEGFRSILIEVDPSGDRALALASGYNGSQCLLLVTSISIPDGRWMWSRVLEFGNDTVSCRLVKSVDVAYTGGGELVAVAIINSYRIEADQSRQTVEHIVILDPKSGDEVARWDISLQKAPYTIRASIAWMGGDTLLVAMPGEVVAYKAPGWGEAWRLDLRQHLDTPVTSAMVALHSCGGKVLALLDGGGVASIGVDGGVEWVNREADLVDPRSRVWCTSGGEAIVYVEPVTYVLRLSDGALLSSFSAGNPYIEVEAGTYIPGKDLMLIYADKKILLYNLSGAKVYEAPNDLVLTGLDRLLLLASPSGDMAAAIGYKPGTRTPSAMIQLFKIDDRGLLRIVDSMPLAPGAEKSLPAGAAWTRHGILVLLDQKNGEWGVVSKLLAPTDTPVLVLTKSPETTGKAVVRSGGGSVVVPLERGRTSVAVPLTPGSVEVSASLRDFYEGIIVMGDLRTYFQDAKAKYTTTIARGEVLHLPIAEVVKAGLGKLVYTPPEGLTVKLVFEYNTTKGPKKDTYPWYASDTIQILVVPGEYTITLEVLPGQSSAPILGHLPQPAKVRVSVGQGEVVELKANLGLAKLVARGTGEVVVKPLPDGEEASIRVEGEAIAWLGPGDYRLTIHYWGDTPIIGPDPGNYTTAEMEVSAAPGQTIELSLSDVLKERLATLVLANPGKEAVVATIIYVVGGEEKGIGIPLAPGEEKTLYLVPGIRYKVLAVYGEDQPPIQVGEIEAEQGKNYKATMPGAASPGVEEATPAQQETTATKQTATTNTPVQEEDTGAAEQATQTTAGGAGESTETGGAQEGQEAPTALAALALAIVIVAAILVARRR